MKVIVIGASGTIGQAVAQRLTARHEVIEVGSKSGALQADMTKQASLHALFDRTGRFDAVIVTAGAVHFGPLDGMTPEHFAIGLQSKLMGQVNVAQVAQHYLNDGGSITLTSGTLSDMPIRYGAAATMTNSAVDGFVRGAAGEISRGIRINVVSPTIVEESLPAFGDYFRGFEAAPAARVAMAYERAIEGIQTGQVIRVE